MYASLDFRKSDLRTLWGIIISAVYTSSTNGNNNDNLNNVPVGEQEEAPGSPDTVSPALTTKAVADLLPSRDDIGTQWKLGENGTFFQEVQNATGVVEVIQRTYSMQDSSGPYIVIVAIAKFESPEGTNTFYDDRKIELYQEGGFEEYELRDIGAECYGRLFDGTFTDRLYFHCNKANIYYLVLSVAEVSFPEHVKGPIENFAKVVANKI